MRKTHGQKTTDRGDQLKKPGAAISAANEELRKRPVNPSFSIEGRDQYFPTDEHDMVSVW